MFKGVETMKKILCSTILATMMFMSVGSYAQNVYTNEQVKPCGNELVCTLNGKLLTGIVKSFYPNGNLWSETTYKDGKPDGWRKEYYENGNLQFETTFKDGKQEGLSKGYYPNGNLEGEGTFKDGKPEGLWKEYYENGNLKDEITFKDGKPEGLVKEYYENGKLRQEVIFESGQAVSGYNYGIYGKKTPMTNAHLHNITKDLEF